ncbi:MAG: aryl-sulfate sulfotransferase [Chitinispirillaceae bacterium]|nr:aryl-sulfate sulfotransferase [Chitinispirillaceae bacterium]
MRIVSLLAVFLSALFATAEKPGGIQYISPVHNSTLNSRTSVVIVRPGTKLDEKSIDFAGQIAVTDALGNRYAGTIRLSSDGKTLVFKPVAPYKTGETVHVSFLSGVKDLSGTTVPSFEFEFVVTPLETALDPKEYISETGSETDGIQNSPVGSLAKTTADELPSGFPRFTFTPGTGTPAPGYIFLSPSHFQGTDGYNLMIDNSGNLAYWQEITDGTPVDFKVLPNGYLCYGSMYEFSKVTGGGPTVFRMMDSSYTVVDSFAMGNGYIAESHEFQLLPNGHALLLSYDLQPVDMSKIIDGGHPGATVVGSIIQELDVDKNVVFQWRSWDHLDIKDSYNPDLKQKVFDPIHVNSIDMTSDNHLLVSIMAFAAISKINRQTGEFIWTVGGSKNQFTFVNEDEVSIHAPQYFMYQHDVRMLENGHITMIDDGNKATRNWARAVEYEIDETAKTATKVWQYRHPDLTALGSMGTAQRLSNGNTLIGWGQLSAMAKTAVTEVDPTGNIVYEITFNGNLWASYRAYKFDWRGGVPAANVLRWELAVDNSYTWNDDDGDTDTGTTGMTMDIKAHNGFGYNEIRAFRYNYAPLKPKFPGKTPVVLPHRIVLVPFNLPGFVATFKFDAEFYNIDNPDSVIVYYRRGDKSNDGIVWDEAFTALPTTHNPVTKQLFVDFVDPGTDTVENEAWYYEIIFAYNDLAHQAFPPLLVSPFNNADADISNARLEWSPVGYAGSYHLQIATDAAFSNLVVDENGLTTAVYTFDASANGPSTYYWRAKTTNDAGESEWAVAKAFNTKAPYIQLTFPNGGESLKWGRENFITWTSINKNDVVIELYKDDGTFLEVIDTATNSGGYTWDVPIDLDTMVSYKIMLKDVADGNISDISDAPFTLTYVGVISENGRSDIKTNDFQLIGSHVGSFNPVKVLRYQLAASGWVELSIYSILGKKVATLVNKNQPAGSYELTFDASRLAPTVYFLKFRAGENFIKTTKLTLMK